MTAPLILPLDACEDPLLVGGKAAGLGRLIRLGFRVPPGLCLTTEAYRTCLRERALLLPQPLLDDIHLALDRCGLSRDTLLAVRSSASDEDGRQATAAGIYRTLLSVPRSALGRAVAECWASLSTASAAAYRERARPAGSPAMAVVIQPLLAPRAAGVAFSRHPVTSDPRQVVINAVPGLAEPLVSGRMTPDQYLVRISEPPEAGLLVEQQIAPKSMAAVGTAAGIGYRSVMGEDRHKPALTEQEIRDLVSLTKQVEQSLGVAVDVEWALDASGWWLLQARPIPAPGPARGQVVWSRANFKETMPDLPSPLGLSFLEAFMEANIIQHYRDLGCRIPPGWSSVRVIQGRPYINVTLFQSFMTQLAGNPAEITEQMGGTLAPLTDGPARLPWWALLRAGLLMEGRVRAAASKAPGWFAAMRRMADRSAPAPGESTLRSPADLVAEMTRLGEELRQGDLTLPIVAGVSQGQSTLKWLLARRLGDDWRPWFNQALRGVGTIISAQQILRLADLAGAASRDPLARAFFLAQPWDPEAWRTRLSGTDVLRAFDAYLQDYGHRAIGESDPASPRFAERPAYLLGVVREHLLAAPAEAPSPEALRQTQESARTEGLRHIRRAFGWRWHERLLFNWAYARLCRFLALREANRHHQMYFTTAVRRLDLELGATLTAQGRLAAPDDIFFLTAEDILAIPRDPSRDWTGLVAARKQERSAHLAAPAPDTIIEGSPEAPPAAAPGGRLLTGIAISAGYVRGPVKLLLSAEDAKRVRKGDIVVAPVIDPGMAPVLGLAGGLVAEMGGTLSHGAIIAREFGLPAVANVAGATRLLKDGEQVAVDASRGEVRRLE